MARLQFDARDQAVLRALDDTFVISNDGEVATVEGDMRVEVVRPTDADGAQLWMTFKFPGGEKLDVKIARAQLLEQLYVGDGENA
jgi:hypothetical protein